MILASEEVAEQQAELVKVLFFRVQEPLPGGARIRGILPGPAGAESIRVVTGRPAASFEQLTAYEIPLRREGVYGLLTAAELIGVIRALLADPRSHPGEPPFSVMGMKLIRIDLAEVRQAPVTGEDNALTVLRCFAYPFSEERREPRLRGFLFLPGGRDHMRLYFDMEDVAGIVAPDVRTSGSVTALIAALPPLMRERERMVDDGSDPHADHLMDLTDW